MADEEFERATLTGEKPLTVCPEDMARTTLFRDVDLGLILDRLRACEVRRVPAGGTLLTQGAANNTLFLVLEGHLYISLEAKEQCLVSVAVVGDCVGEMSVIDGRPATATVLAQVDTTLLAIPGELIWSLIDHTTLVSRNLLYILAGRLRMGDRVISAGHDEKARYQRFATHDLLTGLKNRRWFDDELAHRCEQFHRAGTPFALIIFDVDHFKRFNDTYGHQAGDLVLQRVARAADEAAGERGTSARYGGEEFVVLVEAGAVPDATRLAEDVRAAIANMTACTFEDKQLPSITVSLGVSTLSRGMAAADLVRRADEALYSAKSAGRNRVVAV